MDVYIIDCEYYENVTDTYEYWSELFYHSPVLNVWIASESYNKEVLEICNMEIWENKLLKGEMIRTRLGKL